MKVGFLLDFPVEYKGGINYFKNLFFAVNKYYSSKIQIILFIPPSLSEDIVSIFSQYATIVRTKIIERKSFPWFISNISNRFLKFDFLTYRLLKKNKIGVISYCVSYSKTGKSIKSINWIPDFQILHYPHFWTNKQLKSERKLLNMCVKNSDLIVLSSNDALNDFTSIYPDYTFKTRVLHFVSQPEIMKVSDWDNLSKYADPPFYFLPNQFWGHKNHITVFKAVKIVKERGIDILLLNSGLMQDFRNNNQYINGLIKFVDENKLQKHIKFLGLIPYSDVFGLIRNSVAVINPSHFEGWSSTVEEAKSINKTILLSDIPVHREQNPENGFYFKPDDEFALAELLEKTLKRSTEAVKEDELKIKLDNRTKDFATKYKNILEELA